MTTATAALDELVALGESVEDELQYVADLATVYRARFAAAGMEARSMPPAEFAAFVKREIAKWGKVVKASGAKAE